MIDRVPTLPGRTKMTKADGSTEYVTIERADEPTQAGTPLNKATLFDSNAEARYAAATPSEAFNKAVQILTATVPASGWSSSMTNGWYTNRVNVANMKAVYNPLLDLVITNATLAEDERAAFGLIMEAETFDGYVIFRALDKPDISINVRFVGV